MVGPTRRYPVPLAAAEREDVTINRELFCIGLSLSAGVVTPTRQRGESERESERAEGEGEEPAAIHHRPWATD